MPEQRFVAGGQDGWLNVKREPSGAIVALPEFLRVELAESRNGRDYFTAAEGVERGKKFSVKAGNLNNAAPAFRPPARLQFSLSRGQLSFSGVQVKAITDPIQPIPLGAHPVQIPDFPHDLGASYLTQSRFAKCWFYLGQGVAMPGNNDRYLHPGRVSLGCITVDPGAWTSLYQYLILCRSGDGKTVGTVTVVR